MKTIGNVFLMQPQRLARILVLIVGVVIVTNTRTSDAFVAHTKNNNMMRSSKTLLQQSQKSIIVVSPPGGVGEVTAVKAASMGASVKWFVVTSKYAKQQQQQQQQQQSETSTTATTTGISQDALRDISKAGGNVQLAGADADALLTNERNALAAVATWCSSSSGGGDGEIGTVQGLVCCMDGADNVVDDVENTKENFAAMWKDAIKLAAKEASKGVTGCKLAILSEADDDDDEDDEQEGQGGGLLGGLFGPKDSSAVPNSLSSAIKATAKLRHGALFGIPESSPSFSILLGGPQKNPILCEEYQMRNVRMDPSTGARKDTQSCRHVVGEAAALMITDKVPVPKDVSITSLRGMDKFDLWVEEFERVVDMDRKGQGAVLFSAAFSSVPSIDRLSSWLATKWAPAVMRTYDIAAIRTGARPVFANQIKEDLVEIVWQELVNFESVTVGRLLIQVANDGITATRGPGDASKGFGSISRKPFNGEAILIQRLADAASQAMEKGLANKPAAVKKVAVPSVEVKKPEPAIVSSLQSAQTVATPAVDAASGPRQSGARRSSEKVRGKRIRRASADGEETTSSDDDGAFE